MWRGKRAFAMRLPWSLPLQVSYNAILELAWSGFHMLDTKDPTRKLPSHGSEMLQINIVWPGMSVAPVLLWENWGRMEEETLIFLPLFFPSWCWFPALVGSFKAYCEWRAEIPSYGHVVAKECLTTSTSCPELLLPEGGLLSNSVQTVTRVEEKWDKLIVLIESVCLLFREVIVFAIWNHIYNSINALCTYAPSRPNNAPTTK